MTHTQHEAHEHRHSPGCGHTAIGHDGHTDYLHDGCLHHMEGETAQEHKLSVTDRNPEECTPEHDCAQHDDSHEHGAGCGHEQVPHGDHMDYLVDGHLHHPHGSHCDDHGEVELR